jgi:hypothetical protein
MGKSIDTKGVTTGEQKEDAAGVLVQVPGERANFIIAIGIDDYDQERLQLNSCINDCEGIINALTTNYERFNVFKKLFNKDATEKSIKAAIREFSKSSFNNEFNNLIIYYSGHGSFFETPQKRYYGLVPVEYNDDPENELYKFSDFLINLENIDKITHLLVISDCCSAGGLLNYANFFNFQGDAKIGINDIGLEPSRWGLASSRKDAKSLGGTSTEMSVFTKKLVELLNNNTSDKLYLSELAADLKTAFAQDQIQRVESDKLYNSDLYSGVFMFEAKEDSNTAKKRAAILKPRIRNLNYDNQKTTFTQFQKNVKKQVALLSGTPDCGLSYLLNKAIKSEHFPTSAKTVQIMSVSPPLITENNDTEKRILSFFNALLSAQYDNILSLKNRLLLNLETGSIIIKVCFYTQGTKENSCYTSPIKKQLLEDVIDFIQTINNTYPDDHRLIIFIVDIDRCDYNQLFQNTAKDVDVMYVPVINPMDLQQAEAWYTAMRESYEDDSTDFDRLFKRKLKDKLTTLIDETKGYPGSVIAKICEYSGCSDLAIQLLSEKH